jgi:hypothetical protein
MLVSISETDAKSFVEKIGIIILGEAHFTRVLG